MEVSESADISIDPEDGVGDTTFSSVASNSTDATTAVHDSPLSMATRPQPASQQSLDALAKCLAPSASSVVLEEIDEHSDSEWDVVEAEGGQAVPTARNGGREATLWARGFKDKYRLVISTPRGTSSPLRPPAISRNGSRKGSATSAQSSSNPSPASTPEPPRRPIRRLASVRSSSSTKAGLRSRRSQLSLVVDDNENRASSPSSPGDSTPRKAGAAIKRLTLSAFQRPKA
jgi:hypothetical protein